VVLISEKSSIPKSIKPKINFLNKLIEADIVKHLQENIDQTKEWIKYGQTQYKKDKEFIATKAEDFKAQECVLIDQKNAQYYHNEYQKDKDFIAAHTRKRNLSEEVKT
jgi:hypothetical protein